MKTSIFFPAALVLITLFHAPVNAVAQAPAEDAVAGDVTCTVFPPAQIVPGQNFDIRVSRVPGYPGSWFAPTVTLRISYPTEAGWAYEQRDSRTLPKMGIIRADVTMRAPYSLYPDPQGGFVPGGTVNIVAIVSEATTPVSTRTICTATTTIG